MSAASRGPERVDAIYAQRFPERDVTRAEWRRNLWKVLVDGFFVRWIPADAVVLDYGCGAGEFINAVEARRRIGVDARDFARETLDEGVEFSTPVGIHIPEVEDGSVDVVFCSNLLEHLPDRETVTALLVEFRRVLRPDGRLLILGPNLRYTGGEYWDFFDHHIPLTHRSMSELLTLTGFELQEVRPRFLPYTSKSLLPQHPLLVRLYLRVRPAHWILGKQMFIVARKPH